MSKITNVCGSLLLVVLLLTSTTVASEPDTVVDVVPGINNEEGTCAGWNIQGHWLYEASGGGEGYFDLVQDDIGVLHGSWVNEAGGYSGLFTIGAIIGVSFGLHSDSGEDLQGRVSSDGSKLRGQITGTSYGTFEATGQATCLVRQAPPEPGSGEIVIRWGDYTFRSGVELETLQSIQSTNRSVRVTRIDTPNGVVLTIEVILYGENLPDTILMTQQVGSGEETPGGTLLRDEERSSSTRSIYVRTITLPPTGLTPQNPVKTTTIRGIDPRDASGRRFPIAIVNQRLIDPAGIVFDTTTSAPVVGAMCFLYKQEESQWDLWPAENFGQTNPLPTDDVGHYAWLTDDGSFKVECNKEGYIDGSGGPVTVPPPVLDLDIGLNPTTSPPMPQVSDLVVTGEDGLGRTEFIGGQKLQAHLIVTNTQPSDVQLEVLWTTTDPQGKIVPSLSGQKTYSIGKFAVAVRLDGQVPTSPEGTYTYRVELNQGGQTVFRGTQFWVEGRRPLLLPVTVSNYVGSTTPPPGWVTVFSEDFEGEFSDNWVLGSGKDLRNYHWGKRDCRPHNGNFSGWAPGGGTDGAALPCGSNYPDDMKGWMTRYVDLTDATDTEFKLWLWRNTEKDYDDFFIGASLDGTTFNGTRYSGGSGVWEEITFDLSDVPNLGNLLGKAIHVGLFFLSDSNTNQAEGVYVDDIVLRKFVGSQNTLSSSVAFSSGAPIPTQGEPAQYRINTK